MSDGTRRAVVGAFAAGLALAGVLAGSACGGGSKGPASTGIVIGVASSAARAVESIAAEWGPANGMEVRVSSASSSTLARQIERGSPVRVFVSADRAWVDYLTDRGLGARDSVRVVCGNRLVLYARAKGTPGPDVSTEPIVRGTTLPPGSSGLRWTTGDPDHVPLGRYGRDALQALGWWRQLEPRLLPAADARAAVRLVEMGQADFGVGYATDVVGPEWVARPMDPELHHPIELTAIRMNDLDPDAEAFMAYLVGADAAPHWLAAGFLPPGPGGPR